MDEPAESPDEHQPGRPTWGDVVFEWMFRLAKFYGYVVGIFLVAFVMAYLATFVELAIQGVTLRPYAWIAGAVLAAIGQPLGWIKISGTFQEPESRPSHDKERFRRAHEEEEGQVKSSALSSGLFFGLVGSFLGMLLGGTFILMWFSLALSPFAGPKWSESVEAASAADLEPTTPRQQRRNVSGVKTSSRTAVYLGVGPIVVLGVAGALFGTIAGGMGLVTTSRS